MEKVTLKRTDTEGIYEATSSNGKTAILEVFPSGDDHGTQYLKAVGGNPKRVLVVRDPLFWLGFFDGSETIEIEFERKTLD